MLFWVAPSVRVSQIVMHSEPMTWLQGRRTGRSIVPESEGTVPYSSRHMAQCCSSLARTPRPTLGRRATKASAMEEVCVGRLSGRLT